MSYLLLITLSGTQRDTLALEPGRRYLIGRSAEADIPLAEPWISQRQAVLWLTPEGKLMLQDLSSNNGTFADDRKLGIEPQEILPEQKLFFGPIRTTFLSFAPDKQAQAPRESVKPASDFVLLVDEGKSQKVFPLTPNLSLSLGRKGHGADIELESAWISRQHLSIVWEGGETILVKDVGSANGTFYQGEKVSQISLKQGETLGIGQRGNPQLTWKRQETEALTPIARLGAEEQDWAILLEKKEKVRIGRATDNDICLPHPAVSRYHAELEKVGTSYFMKDLGSSNGTFIGTKPVRGRVEIVPGASFRIGPYSYEIPTAQQKKLNLKPKASTVLLGKNLSTHVKDRNGKGTIAILNQASLAVEAGTMLAIMGPSGCGKSTLLNALNGKFPATEGEVYLLGQKLTRDNYAQLKHFIGYVPQDDIVHKTLTVEQCLFYAARLKLKRFGFSAEEMQQRIDEVLEDLKMDDPKIRQTLIGKLSGGQRKRISIAVELLPKPPLLFLDEPTSPLDPQTIDDFLSCLKSLTQARGNDLGTTIVLVTHKPEDLEFMDQVAFMAAGGYLTFCDRVDKYAQHFSVSHPREVYRLMADRSQGPRLAEAWQQRLKLPQPSSAQPSPTKVPTAKDSAWEQFYWLARRYFQIKTNDRLNTMLLLLQAPLIAVLMCLIFEQVNLAVLFVMVISAIWFGTNNAAREIVGELPIYLRERMYNLKILPFLFSKLGVLSLFSLAQIVLFTLILTLVIDELQFDTFGINVFTLFLLCFASILMGLLISASMQSSEQVMTVVPIVLIPQILLCGVLTPLDAIEETEYLSFATLSRWGTEAMVNIEGDLPQPQPLIDSTAYCAPREGEAAVPWVACQVEEVEGDIRLVMEDQWVAGIDLLQFSEALKYEDLALDLIALCTLGLLLGLATFAVLRSKDPFRRLGT